ncbi:hypothetical protein [Kandleria vitulina]|uniref:hypothetical protein n=1 Tax=Kandleria vitulina TaxID=1630 RepID=UPI00117A1E9D|nr:hypothetical protein [Kandleria vitulina]
MNKKLTSIYISATVLSGVISVPSASTVVKRYPRLDFSNLINNMGEIRFSNEKSYSIKKTMMDNEQDNDLNNNEETSKEETSKEETSKEETSDEDTTQNDTSNNDTAEEDSSKKTVQGEVSNEDVKQEDSTNKNTKQDVSSENSVNQEDTVKRKGLLKSNVESPSEDDPTTTVNSVSDEEVLIANQKEEDAKKKYKDLERFDQDDKDITVPRVNKEVNTNEIVDVPQGIAMDDNYVYISSYDGIKAYLSDLGKSNEQIDVHNSVIYVLRLNDELRKYKTIVLPDTNHVGGLTCLNGQLWISLDTGNSSRQKLVYLNTKTIHDQLNWDNDDKYEVDRYDGENKINGVTSASFVTSFNDDLYVGTFNSSSNSVIKGFHPGSEDAFVSYSVIKKAQGAAFTTVNGITYLMVSSSYGRVNSSGLYAYSVTNVGQSDSKISAVSSIVLPGMSEGIVEKDGTLYVLFESGSHRYNANPMNSAVTRMGKVIAGKSSNMVNMKRTLSDSDIDVSVNATSFSYNGKIHYPRVTSVKYKNMYLPYSIKYTASKTPGTYVMTITINTPTYSGVKNIRYTINKANANVSLSRTSFTYNKKVQKPSVKSVVIVGGHKIKVKKVEYLSPKSKKVGIYTIKITLKDNPYATRVIYRAYKIVPKATKIKSHKAKKGAITLKWKKQDARYEIQYSTQKNMKNAVSKKFKTATSTTLKHLSRKKYYYVRIRTYKIVNGKYIYSAYSSIRKIRTK